MARGLSTEDTQKLMYEGLTLTAARSMPTEAIVSLGLSLEEAKKLGKNGRPPIPPELVSELIFRSAATCCVCQVPNKEFILHHIKSWEDGGRHTYENLVVLCLEDHGKAHSINGLSRNLTPDEIRTLKSKWEETVLSRQANEISIPLTAGPVHWDYVNHRRLFELVAALGVSFHDQRSFLKLREWHMIGQDGTITNPQGWSPGKPQWYLYDVYEGMHLHDYVKGLLNEILPNLRIADVTDRWSKAEFRKLRTNQYITCQKAFYCKRLTQHIEGRGQTAEIYRKESGIRLTCKIDLWEATSMSSKSEYLSGRKVLTPILKITSIDENEDDGSLHVSASCLAITCSAQLHDTPSTRWELNAKFGDLWADDEFEEEE